MFLYPLSDRTRRARGLHPRRAARRVGAAMLVPVLGVWKADVVGAELAETVAGVKPSVVAVGSLPKGGSGNPVLRGSGFVVADGRHVVTTTGAVSGGSAKGRGEGLAVFLPAGVQRARGRPARVVLEDAEHDISLLRFDGRALPALRIGRSADVREGELLAYTGFPTAGTVGLHTVTHRGIVSAISPNVVPPMSAKAMDRGLLEKLARPYPVFQLDVSAFPGNDGSPLYEPATGRVVGIINSTFVKTSKELSMSRSSGISYAIPVDHVRALLTRAGLGY